jgi:hypothetical protein
MGEELLDSELEQVSGGKNMGMTRDCDNGVGQDTFVRIGTCVELDQRTGKYVSKCGKCTIGQGFNPAQQRVTCSWFNTSKTILAGNAC